jgi:hypothetical protein
VAALIGDCLCAFEPYQAVENRAGRPLQVITEQNMLTEYRFGKSLAATFGN